MIIDLAKDLDKLDKIKAGDRVYITGTIFTARDAAHLRISEMVKNNLELPFSFSNSLIYYAGPTPTKPNTVVGSIGPTTSSRMDKFAYLMPKLNVLGVIGKGPRSNECTKYYIDNKIMYFIATGGAGALLSTKVTSAKEIAFTDLGPESVKELTVKEFPVICAIDLHGNNLFKGE